MIDDMIVVDGVVHCYNWTRDNWAIPESEMVTLGGAGFHQLLTTDDESRLSHEEFLRDWSAEEVARTVFFESPVDIAAHHGTPLFDFYKDGHSATEKGFEMRELFPDRVVVYGAVNPYDGQKALDLIDEYADRGCTALKVYAATYDHGKTRAQDLNNDEFGYPFIQKAVDRGIKVIASHKAIPFGPVRPGPYGVQDIPEVCATFPQMNFEIVHAGFAWVEETGFLSLLPNCWLNLEVSSGLIFNQPRRFAEFLGHFLFMGLADRIIFATGCALVHPRPSVEAFLNWEMPQELVQGFGYAEVTPDVKRGILGENWLRLHGIDRNDFLVRTADDEVSRYRGEHGLDGIWSKLRSGATVA
jgi:predicted TIM-barrel fold metal-dependent hydrolase